MSYVVHRQDRFYVVAYDGLDPLTGGSGAADTRLDPTEAKPRRSPPGSRSTVLVPPARGGPLRLDDFLRSTWLPHKRRQARTTTSYRYAWFVEHYIARNIGHVPLRRLRADHLNDLCEQLAITGGRDAHGPAPRPEGALTCYAYSGGGSAASTSSDRPTTSR